MGVWYSNSFDEEPEVRQWLFGDMAEDLLCFLCGEPMSFPLVMWAGSTGHIYLHEHCAPGFVLRISRDCWELQRDREHKNISDSGEIRRAG